jgi:putative addiction module component (TIGR02574 family)
MIDISSLTREQRLRLLEQLWDSLATVPEALPLTEGQQIELDHRLDAFASEGQAGVDGMELLERLRKTRQ